jgi:hypothetical protein
MKNVPFRVAIFSGYALVSSGTCQSNNRYEVPQADCETAATSLGLSDTSVSLNEYSARPPGCIYLTKTTTDILRFNTMATSETSCGSGDYNYDCLCGALEGAVIDLLSANSPYSGSTSGNSDDVDVCGSGAEQGFAGFLEPGSTITIGQTSNTFDSKHTLRYGGLYPGDKVVQCVDDPDTATLSFTNAGNANVPVYFLVDAYSGSGGGDFLLAWKIGILGEFLWDYCF